MRILFLGSAGHWLDELNLAPSEVLEALNRRALPTPSPWPTLSLLGRFLISVGFCLRVYGGAVQGVRTPPGLLYIVYCIFEFWFF